MPLAQGLQSLRGIRGIPRCERAQAVTHDLWFVYGGKRIERIHINVMHCPGELQNMRTPRQLTKEGPLSEDHATVEHVATPLAASNSVPPGVRDDAELDTP